MPINDTCYDFAFDFSVKIPVNKQETYRYLNDRGIHYEITEHPAVFNMAEVALLTLPYPEVNAKNLFVRDKKKRFYILTVRGNMRADLKAFRKKLGVTGLSFASVEELESILKLYPGAVTPLGLLNDTEKRVTLYIDEWFMGGMIGLHPNDNTATIWMQAADLVKVLEAEGHTVKVIEI